MKIRKTLLFISSLYFSLLIFNSVSYAMDVKREVLDNGLTLLIVERHNLPIVKVSVGINAGSIVEPQSYSKSFDGRHKEQDSGSDQRGD